MLSSVHRILACLLCLGIAALAHTQNGLTKDQTATISGKVTIKKKPASGVPVIAVEINDNSDFQHPRQRGATDDEGNYRISNLAAGNYYVYPVAQSFVVDNGPGRQQVVVVPGETIRDIDFALVPGGAITGRITNADGQPLIEETVFVTPLYQQEFAFAAPDREFVRTDDRGIYRAFGLRQGKYIVSVGNNLRSISGEWRRTYRQTFYPSVTDSEKATILELSEAGEIRGVDIVTGQPVPMFKASGRIVDSETGKPVPDVTLSLGRTEGNVSINSAGATGSDRQGIFRLENLAPGKYILFPFSETSNLRAEPLAFEIVDRDLTGLEIKSRRGAVLSGVVVVKDGDDKSSAVKFERFEIFAFVEGPLGQNGGRVALIRPDGSFKLVGLPSGNARLTIAAIRQDEPRQMTIVSLEQNGVPQQSGGIEVKEGELVEGITIFVKNTSFAAVIRGHIKFENGEPPPGATVSVTATLLDELTTPEHVNMPVASAVVDSRGRFMMEHLAGGTYSVSAAMFEPGGVVTTAKQQVTVAPGAVSDVVLTIKLKP